MVTHEALGKLLIMDFQVSASSSHSADFDLSKVRSLLVSTRCERGV